MSLGERWGLVALCCAVAAASAVAVDVADRVGILKFAPTPEPIAAQEAPRERVTAAEPAMLDTTAPAQQAPGSDVALNTWPLEVLPPDDEPEPGGAAESEAQDNPESWPAEIRREAPKVIAPPVLPSGPRLLPPPAQPLPWQTAVPPPPQSRDKAMMLRLVEISPGANKRLAEKFEAAKVEWPPAEIGLVAIKDEKILELFARPSGGTWKLVHRYPVLAASGGIGPKLRQGDKQVPEGVYGISFLNPVSRYHVSMRVNYPNAFDRQMAEKDGRKELGGDIMIHGKNVSAGCLAIGDEAAEELFVLAARIGTPNIKVIIAPTDLRTNGAPTVEPAQPVWLPKLYTEVASAMAEFKKPPSSGLLSFFGK